MEILDFFEPVDLSLYQEAAAAEEATWFHALEVNQGSGLNLEDKKIALIGIVNGEDPGTSAGLVRKYLYRLKRAEYAEEIVDLGDFYFNYQPKAYESLGFVLSELIAHNLTPVIINGRQDLTYAQYLGFSYLKHFVSLVNFDARIDFDLREHDEMTPLNYVQTLLTAEPSYLFNYTTIGYQSHFADSNILEFMEKLHFESHRLGEVQANMPDLEPALRGAHLASWDLGAIRQADAPAALQTSPNGLYGEEACTLCRFAGLSSNLRSIGFYNYVPEKDRDEQTAHLTAQMIWYFTDGYLNRYPESPSENAEDFLKYITAIQNNAYQIVFYKSKRTDRWWMEVPVNENDYPQSKYIMPCAYSDYQAASREEIPDRWLQAVRKLS